MSLEKLGIPIRCYIRDPVLGSIPIYEHEYHIIQLPVLNRLHYIKQTSTLYYVYPCAKHSRFEHSIGVMYIAGKITETILDRLFGAERNPRGKLSIVKLLLNEKNKKIRKLLPQLTPENPTAAYLLDILPSYMILYARLAGLLHDLGHIAFSHVAENLVKRLIEADPKARKEFSKLNCKPHEYLTYKIVEQCRKLDTILSQIPEPDIEGMEVNKQTLTSILLGKLVDYENVELSARAIEFLHRIISSDIDADRLDFILRDAYFTGIPMLVDIDRIIEGYHPHLADAHDIIIAHDVKTLPALENFIYTRVKMYEQVYYHHKSIVYNIVVEKLAEIIKKENLVNDLFNTETVEDLAKKICSEDPSPLTDHDFVKRLEELLNKLKGDRKHEFEYYLKCLKDRRYLPASILKRRGEIPQLKEYIQACFNNKTTLEISDYEVKRVLTNLEQKIETALNKKQVIEKIAEILANHIPNIDTNKIKIFSKTVYVKALEKYPGEKALEAQKTQTPLVKINSEIKPLIEVSPLISDLRKNLIHTPPLYTYLAYLDPAYPYLYETFTKNPNLKNTIKEHIKNTVNQELAS